MTKLLFAFLVSAGLLVMIQFHNEQPPGRPRQVIGAIKQINTGAWGLEVDFSWKRPFAARHLRIQSLPTKFQVQDLRVGCRCQLHDVVGPNDWDVVVDALDLTTIE